MTDEPFMANEVRERHMLTAHFPKLAALLRRSVKLRASNNKARKATERRAVDVERKVAIKGEGAFAYILSKAAWYRATGGGLDAPYVVDWAPANGSLMIKSPETKKLN
jgi:hypothetical protein